MSALYISCNYFAAVLTYTINNIYRTRSVYLNIINGGRASSLNSGIILNIGSGPLVGHSVYDMANGREAANQLMIGRKVANRPISV